MDNVFAAPNSNRVCMFLEESEHTASQGDKFFGINGSDVGNLKNSRSSNRLGTQQAKEFEKSSEDSSRQRVLRDRAAIEQREMMMRFGRNPGQNSFEADDVVSASPCEARAKVKKQVGKVRNAGSCGGTLAWRLHLRRSRREGNQESLKQQMVVTKDTVGCKVCPSEISTKRLAAFQWWSRKDVYRCSVLASASGFETTIVDDPVVGTR